MTIPGPLLTVFGFALVLAALALSTVRRRRLSAALAALAERVAALEAPAAVVVPNAAPVRPVRVPPARRVDRPVLPGDSGPILIAVPNMAATAADASTADATSSDLGRRYAAIWEMADAGTPTEAIARETGQPVGQVELILGLKRRRPAAPGGPRTS